MFFKVDSGNRHAVRQLLTASGLPSTEVRKWPNALLGSTLYRRVQSGVISTEDAVKATGEAQPIKGNDVSADAQVIPTTELDTMTGKTSDKLADAIRELVGKPQLDQEAVVALIRAELKTQPQGLVAVEIKADGNVIGKIEGKSIHKALPEVITTLACRVQSRRLHVWLVGPSGSGKSYLAAQAAEALKLPYYSTSAIQSKYDLIGFVSPTGTEVTLRTPFRNAFENGGVFAWDDIDASDPRAFVAFNEALSNGRFAFPDKMVDQHADFVCIASANTWGNGATADYVGRNKIDAATLSRFVRIEIDYDTDLEKAMVGPAHADWANFVIAVRAAVKKEGIKVLVTPRHTLQGAALLAAGIKPTRVRDMTVFAGLELDVKKRLAAAVASETVQS